MCAMNRSEAMQQANHLPFGHGQALAIVAFAVTRRTG